MFRSLLVGHLCLCAVFTIAHESRSRNIGDPRGYPYGFPADSQDLLGRAPRILEYDEADFHEDKDNRIRSSEDVFEGDDETPEISERISRRFDESDRDSESSFETRDPNVPRNLEKTELNLLAKDSPNPPGRRLPSAPKWPGKRLHRERRNLDDSQEDWGDSDADDYDWSPRYSEAGPGETAENSMLAGMIAEMMADSQWQLVLDLDLFKTLFTDPGQKFEKSVREGDESYIRQLMSFLEPLKEYDVSAPCLADLSHFFLSSIEYTRSLRESYCSNCSCDGRAHDTKQHQWIFNGNVETHQASLRVRRMVTDDQGYVIYDEIGYH